MKAPKRSRHDTKVPEGRHAVFVEQPTPRDREIFQILHWHRYLPVTWIHAHFQSDYGDIQHRCGILKQDQNAFLGWPPAPLNSKLGNSRHGVYELAPKGAESIGVSLRRTSKHERAHDLIASLHECALKFQARKEGVSFEFLEPEEYELPSGMKWRPDGHPILYGDTLIHSEIERRHYNESPKKTEEKIEKAYEYVKTRMYEPDAKSGIILFLSTSEARTTTLKRYVEKKFTTCSFIGFGTTLDWAEERSYPNPQLPLVTEWERVGFPPLNLKG